MALSASSTIMGWIPNPANAGTVVLPKLTLISKEYDFARFRIAYGRASAISKTPHCHVEVDGSNNLIPDIGNDPIGLYVEQVVGGYLRLHWQYNNEYEPATPTGFKIYLVNGGEALQDTIAHQAGRYRYSWLSGALVDGTTYLYRVKAYRFIDPDTHIKESYAEASGVADSSGPPAITNLTATALT